ncbi:MAG: SDR family oxidoreductase [Candidatus Sungbacteria bacterium]|nr:SDR family oxidoreductase [Candidatus Sungbacteria bacterium]
MPKRIFIAGGAGYIGSRLVPYLRELGHDVTVLDLLWFGNHLPQDVPVVKKNVIDVEPSDLKGFDQVIFLAGLSNDPMAEYSPGLNFVHNAAAPSHLAYIAKQAGVKRFIYADSCSVYGNTKDALCDEETVARSAYPYGISKLQGGFGAHRLEDDSFSVISLRQGTLSGFSPRMRFDLLVNTMYKTALTEGRLVVNNPAIWRPYLAMTDALEAYRKAIEAPYSVSGTFIVASGNATIKDVADDVSRYFAKRHAKQIAVETHDRADQRSYRVSNQKAQDVLGVSFHGTVPGILQELDERIGNDCDFHHDRYHNIATFKKLFTKVV